LCERAEGFAPARAEAFAAWRDVDPRNAAAVARVERTLALLDKMPAVRAPLEARVGRVNAKSASPHRGLVVRFPRSVWAAGLAAALVVMTAAWWFGSGRGPSNEHYLTAATVRQGVALRDGSIVDLNTSSEVRVDLGARERRVTLAAGEAHFAVAPDPARPFIVKAAGVVVRAVGTAFSVRVGEAGVDVLVTEGRVEVAREAPAAAAPPAPPVERPQLVAGERASIPRAEAAAPAKIEAVSAEALRVATSWHSVVIAFSDLPLRAVVAQFNRRNAVQLVLADAELGARRIGGTFAIDQVEAFVRLLEQDGDVVAERRGPREIVLRRTP
jgi:transmembrane sensor